MSGKLGPLKIIQPRNGNATGSVIFFHGSGDTGQGVSDWIKFLIGTDLSFPHLRVSFPTAPIRPYTPLNKQPSNVWFDRYDINPEVPEHKETLESICYEIKGLITDEIATGIPLSRIAVGGFSMGGALALHTAFRFLPNLAGVFTLSSFLNHGSAVYDVLKQNRNKQYPPLLMCHGARDDLVPIEWGEETFQNLKTMSVKAQFVPYENALHELKKTEIEKLVDWINEIIPEKAL